MMYDEIKMRYSTLDLIPDEQTRNGLLTGQAYYQDIVEFPTDDIEAYCATFQGETLFLHGTNDMAVYYGYSVRANELYSNISIPGVVYGLKEKMKRPASNTV